MSDICVDWGLVIAFRDGEVGVMLFEGGEEYGEKTDLGSAKTCCSSQSESAGVMVGGEGASCDVEFRLKNGEAFRASLGDMRCGKLAIRRFYEVLEWT